MSSSLYYLEESDGDGDSLKKGPKQGLNAGSTKRAGDAIVQSLDKPTKIIANLKAKTQKPGTRPHRFEYRQGKGLRVAPGVVIDASDLAFMLFDGANQPLAGAEVEFHVAYGGGQLLVPGTQGYDEPQAVVKAKTDSNGKESKHCRETSPRNGKKKKGRGEERTTP